MTPLAEIIIATMDLARVKLVQARAGAYQLALALALLLVAAMLLLAGMAFMLYAVNQGLNELLPAWQASAATSVLALLIGGILIWLGKTKTA